ncbi:HPr family phosphocarrier protein [Kineococcus sp. T13]|uniref:HPr family phosphocarrier protein n=1 Tax=Kineococcus vitellinus TaxID=2696565 RepID=UPI001413351B|nr:HPr family phosphocarrier protein [Kineococcus vitellinus]
MPTRTAVVGSRVGLHARPASLLVQAVTASGLPVTLSLGDRGPVDARSILLVMGLGARHGDRVVLSLDDTGAGADAVLERLAALVETDHDALA